MSGSLAAALLPTSVAAGLVPLGLTVDLWFTPVSSVLGGAVGAFATTLVVGAIVVAVAPEYVEQRMADLRAEPVECFAYGVVCLLFLALVTLVLFVTIIGVLVAVPLVLLAVVVWAVGSAIAYLAVAERIVDRGDGWTRPLLVAAGLNGALTLTGIGALVAFCVGAAGFGAVLRDSL